MPKIPTYKSNRPYSRPHLPEFSPVLASANVRTQSTITAKAPFLKATGDLQGQVLQGIGNQFLKEANRQLEMAKANELVSAVSNAQEQLEELEVRSTGDMNYEAYSDRYASGSDEIYNNIKSQLRQDRETQLGFKQEFYRSRLRGLLSVNTQSMKVGKEVNQAQLLENLDKLGKRAAEGNGMHRESSVKMATGLINQAIHQKFVTADSGVKMYQKFLGDVDQNRALELIVNNPAGAMEVLKNENHLPGLDPETRTRLLDKAIRRIDTQTRSNIAAAAAADRKETKLTKKRQITNYAKFTTGINRSFISEDEPTFEGPNLMEWGERLETALIQGDVNEKQYDKLRNQLNSGGTAFHNPMLARDFLNRIRQATNKDQFDTLDQELIDHSSLRDINNVTITRAETMLSNRRKEGHFSKDHTYARSRDRIGDRLRVTGRFAALGNVEQGDLVSAAEQAFEEILEENYPHTTPAEAENIVIDTYRDKPRSISAYPRPESLGSARISEDTLRLTLVEARKKHRGNPTKYPKSWFRQEVDRTTDLRDALQNNQDAKSIEQRARKMKDKSSEDNK